MKYEMIELKKNGYELDFIKQQGENHFTCATNFANKCGMDRKYINKLINHDEILRDTSYNITTRDQINRTKDMVFIHSDHFLYFLSLIKGLKATNCPPNFVKNLMILYPMFLRELTRKANILLERMDQNRIDQTRINKIEKLMAYLNSEKKRLSNEIRQRNIEDVDYAIYTDGSVQPELELDDHFQRTIINIDITEKNRSIKNKTPESVVALPGVN